MKKIQPNSYGVLTIFHLLLLLQPISPHTNCSSESQHKDNQNKHESFQFKLAAIVSILASSLLGVSIPMLLKNVSSLQPNKPFHFLIKAFAAGVILATGFIHILPDAFDSLTSPCLGENPWGGFPLAGLIAMMVAVGTLMMEGFATGYHRRAELRKALPLEGHEESDAHTANSVHTHVPSIFLERSNSLDLIRNRVISQVLELGIVVHSVIIGISLGATQSPKIIKPLITALSFHQFFEGIGLGGCISQAKFKTRAITIMALFFALTTPVGISIGIVISKVYNGYSSTALIVEGVLSSASAGILINMALVDLLAADFMNPKLLNDFKIKLGANFTLLLGLSSMSLMAKFSSS